MNNVHASIASTDELARSLSVPLATVMSRSVVSVRAGMSIETLREIMVERSVSAVPVLNESGEVVGLVAAADIVRAMHEQLDYGDLPAALESDPVGEDELENGFQIVRTPLTARDVMRPITLQLPESCPLMHAVALMADHGAHRVLVVTENGDVVGMVTANDVLQTIATGSRDSGVLPIATNADADWADAPFVGCSLDADRRIVEANLALATALRTPVDALAGQVFRALVLEEDHPLLANASGFVVRMRRSDGSHATIDWRVRSTDGREQSLVGYDLSPSMRARRRLDAALRVGRATAGKTSLRVAAPQALYWLARSEEWESACLWWIDPRDGELRRETHWPLEVDGATSFEDRGLAERVVSTGEPLWVFDEEGVERGHCAIPLRLDNRVVGVVEIEGAAGPLDDDLVALLDSMTERLVASDAANEGLATRPLDDPTQTTHRLAIVGSLAGGVAHYVNNALTYVRLSLGRLISYDLSRAPHTPSRLHRIEMLQEVREGFDRVEAIAKHLNAFSRVDETPNEAVDLAEVLDSTTRLLDHELLHRARVVCDYGQVPDVLGNASGLRQAFLDIILSVARSIDEGHATDNEIRVRVSTLDDRVVVAVRATQSQRTPRDAVENGLIVARDVIASFGGDLNVVSEGHGVSVRATLRVARRAPKAPDSRPAIKTAYATGCRILVVDDERFVAEAISVVLSEHEVKVAANGREALELIQRGHRFDVVFCDLMMPEMTGMDLFEAVEYLDPAFARRFVFMTGGAYTVRARTFVDRITNICLLKPFDSGSLHEAIERTIHSQ